MTKENASFSDFWYGAYAPCNNFLTKDTRYWVPSLSLTKAELIVRFVHAKCGFSRAQGVGLVNTSDGKNFFQLSRCLLTLCCPLKSFCLFQNLIKWQGPIC